MLENPTLKAFTSIKHVQKPYFLTLDFKTSRVFSTSSSKTSLSNAGAGGRSLHFMVMDEARGGKDYEAKG